MYQEAKVIWLRLHRMTPAERSRVEPRDRQTDRQTDRHIGNNSLQSTQPKNDISESSVAADNFKQMSCASINLPYVGVKVMITYDNGHHIVEQSRYCKMRKVS